MATESFQEPLVIHNDEEAAVILKLLDEAEKRGPDHFPDFTEALERGKELLKRLSEENSQ